MVKQKAKVVALPRRGRPAKDALSQLDELAQTLTAAVNDNGTPTLLAASEHALAELAQATGAHIIVNVGGFWRTWRRGDQPDNVVIASNDLPPDAHQLSQPTFHGQAIFLPIRKGALAALLVGARCGSDSFTALHIAAGCIDLALTSCEQSDPKARSPRELNELYTASARILGANGMDALMLALSRESKRLLAADICATTLRNGDEIVTRHCVGQFSVDGAQLAQENAEETVHRMLETLDPSLAGGFLRLDGSVDVRPGHSNEEVRRSTLAAPVLSGGEIVGLIEVWRRSAPAFDRRNRMMLLALSALTSLNLDNATREKLVSDMAGAGADLDAEGATVRHVTHFQQSLVAALMGESGLDAIAQLTARKLDAAVAILNAQHDAAAVHSTAGGATSSFLDRARKVLSRNTRTLDTLITETTPSGTIHVQPVAIRGEPLAYVICESELPLAKLNQLVLSQVATILALHFLEQREAERERAQKIQNALWDLFEGSEHRRAAAMARAGELQITEPADRCVVICRIDGLTEIDPFEKGVGHSGHDLEQLIKLAKTTELGAAAQVLGLRGCELRIVCSLAEKAALLSLVADFIGQIRQELPALRLYVGISNVSHDVRSLASAFREAKIALEVAQHQSAGFISHYSDVGLVGLLINLRSAADMRRVSGEILGDLLTEPENSRSTLIDTLKAFFEADCSQLGAAAILGTHQKTIAYRLAKITRLTGLDLSKHQDRLLADLAVRVFSMINIKQPPALR